MASTYRPDRLSAVPIFSCVGSRVIDTGQPPDVDCRPVASESLWIRPSGEAAYTTPAARSATGEECVIWWLPWSAPTLAGEKVHSRFPVLASRANVRP